jgi:hypothetical protein
MRGDALDRMANNLCVRHPSSHAPPLPWVASPIYLHSTVRYSAIISSMSLSPSLTLIYQATLEGGRSSIRASTIPIAGSENSRNSGSSYVRVPHGSVATPIRETCLYAGTKFSALSGQRTETRMRYCSTETSVCWRIQITASSLLLR